MQKTYTALAWIFGAVVVFAIFDANTGGSSAASKYFRSIPHGDKFAHFMLFGCLSFLLNLALALKQIEIAGYSVYRGSLLVSLFVVLEELSQYYIPSRTFDFYDLMADFAGIIFFAIPTMIIARRAASKPP